MSDTVPAPFIWQPSGQWLGADGNWSTFQLSVGTPEQSFYVLPSTTNSETWVIAPDGCAPATSPPSNCASLRGIGDFQGHPSAGFQQNLSTTPWRQIGLYGLGSESSIQPGETGLFGLDRLVLNPGQNSLSIANQTVASIASQYFWLGSVGLANQGAAFGVVNGDVPSLITQLASQNKIPSSSYGFTAGAAYANSPGSLVLGGYDAAAVKLDNISWTIPSGNSLLVNLASIVASNTLIGTASMLVSNVGLTMKIDSTISQMWLPTSVCDSMAQAFGLTYDQKKNLYLINSTMRSKLQQSAPQLTFTLAQTPSSTVTTNIVLPYSAFDLLIGFPTYSATYAYFPIRQAANETQYILGRAFLQEAYIVVDWERSNFTLGQVQHNRAEQNIVTIRSTNDALPQPVARKAPLGAIIGVTVGGVVGLCLLFLLTYSMLRRRRRRAASEEEVDVPVPPEYPVEKKEAIISPTPGSPPAELHGRSKVGEAMSTPLHELDEQNEAKIQLMSNTFYELPGHSVSQEVAAPLPTARSPSAGQRSPLSEST